MGFFKKRGKPRQYRIRCMRDQRYDKVVYEVSVWGRILKAWNFSEDHASLVNARTSVRLDAALHGYGDNYEITELI